MKRRALLAGGSAAALTVVFGACAALPVIPKRPRPAPDDAAGWLRHAGGRYTLFVPCAEMGQHIGSALRRIAALELGVAETEVRLVLPASTEIERVRATVGSDSVKDFALPLAQACATLRIALAQGVTAAMLRAQPHPPERLRSFAALHQAGDARAEPLAFLHDIVTGAPLYAADVQLPGMRYGRVLRAPVSPALSSRAQTFDVAAARAVPGFVAVVEDERLRHAGSVGLGVVAATPGAVDRVAQALAPQWHVEGGFAADEVERRIDIDTLLQRGALRHRVRGDTLHDAPPWSIDLRFDIPLAAHAGIEPRAAVARFERNAEGVESLHVHAGTQDLFYVRDTLARRLALDAARVRVQACRIGGGFGSRTIVNVELEAALLARAVGAPVKVQWTRAQEFACGFHRPPSSHRIRARLDDRGRIVDWWHAFASSHILFTPAAMPPWLQRAADFIGDAGVARGAKLPYDVPRQRIEFDALRLPVHTGPWRGLGAGPNALAIESAFDACAVSAGADPLEFRLAHAGDARLRRVLHAVAHAAGWQRRPASDAEMRRGRGIACGIYKDASYAAAVAEVEVERASGRVRVTAIWCAHDCGRIVMPDGVRAQVEGNLVWCLGMVLMERLRLAANAVSATGFDTAPIPRIGDLPALHVALVDSDAPPSGAGEAAMVAGGGAIANAIFAACGVRCTRFPVTPEALRDAR